MNNVFRACAPQRAGCTQWAFSKRLRRHFHPWHLVTARTLFFVGLFLPFLGAPPVYIWPPRPQAVQSVGIPTLHIRKLHHFQGALYVHVPCLFFVLSGILPAGKERWQCCCRSSPTLPTCAAVTHSPSSAQRTLLVDHAPALVRAPQCRATPPQNKSTALPCTSTIVLYCP